jgi:NADPH:quinone reductase-like Zn-dependent oxidoreductase
VKKIIIDRPGSYDRLRLAEAPSPAPGPGEVRIKVAAIGANYADCVVRMGLYASAKKYVGWPITPGFEVAGTIDALGEGASGLELGAEVIAVSRFGGYASELVAPAHQVFPLPRGLSMIQGAALPTVYLTAYYALFELARPRPGAKVLVHSAAGGVGGALCQIATIAGCEVVGVVGASHKVEAARAMGAAVVIDKSREELWQAAERAAPGGYDVVLDANGVSTLRASYEHVAPTGRLVVYGFHSMLPRAGGRPNWLRLAVDFARTPRFSPLALTQENRAVLGFNLSYLFERADLLDQSMRAILSWFEDGRLTPPRVQTYPLAAVAEVHSALESGQTIGKLVMTP